MVTIYSLHYVTLGSASAKRSFIGKGLFNNHRSTASVKNKLFQGCRGVIQSDSRNGIAAALHDYYKQNDGAYVDARADR
jgi:hypothetical protein